MLQISDEVGEGDSSLFAQTRESTRGGPRSQPARVTELTEPADAAAPRPARRARFQDPGRIMEKNHASAQRAETAVQRAMDRVGDLRSRQDTKLEEVMAFLTRLTAENRANRDEVNRALELMQKSKSRENAHLYSTLDKILKNIAGATTDLKHAKPLEEMARECRSKAAELDAAEATASIQAVQAAASRRSSNFTPDADGFKMSQVPANRFEDFDPMTKALYAGRDGVRSQEDFDRVSNRACKNCDPDVASMPHREKHCTNVHVLSKRGAQTANAMRKERAAAAIKQRTTAVADIRAAMASEGDDASALDFLCEICEVEVSASDDCSILLAAVGDASARISELAAEATRHRRGWDR